MTRTFILSLLLLTIAAGRGLAQEGRLTTITLRGTTVTNVTEVRVLKETGKIMVLWPGGGGSYDSGLIPNKFLESWGIKPFDVTKVVVEKQEAEAEAERRQIKAASDFAASYPGLGHIDEIRKILAGWNSGLKNMRSYHFSAAAIQDVRKIRSENPNRTLFDSDAMEIERHISSTFPLTVYKGMADNGMRIAVVTMHTNVLRIRLTGQNRLESGTEANTMKAWDLHLFAGLVEGTIERNRSGSDESIISKMLQRQVDQVKKLGRYHASSQASAFRAFSCIQIRGEASFEYMLNICDSKLGELYALKTIHGHPDAGWCPSFLNEGLVAAP